MRPIQIDPAQSEKAKKIYFKNGKLFMGMGKRREQGWHLGIYLGKNIGGKTWGKTGKKGFEKLGKNWEKPGETGKNLKNSFKTFVSTDNAKLLM